MDKEGFRSLETTLSVFRSPYLKTLRISEAAEHLSDGEELRHFSVIEDGPGQITGVDPARILRILDEAGLMLHSEKEFDPNKDSPQLKYLGTAGKYHSFEDLATK
jgi:hypothetical protein